LASLEGWETQESTQKSNIDLMKHKNCTINADEKQIPIESVVLFLHSKSGIEKRHLKILCSILENHVCVYGKQMNKNSL